ncbi:MAG: sigma-54-dependent Fis family transcriptional regulator [Verrucomicrobiales bacterium]|nr:sigma-54-dependent Fis family transcriptional regulator [Verrucomicrobiales bacterium]
MTSGRILLIEDDVSVASALSPVLSEEGFTVQHAGRGDEGLARALGETFDAVLTDLRLPGLDGLTLVEQLHRARPRLPIILITAHGTTETAIQAMKQGAFDYLLKPCDMRELLDLLTRAVAAGRRMVEPVAIGTADPAEVALVGSSRVMQAVYKEIGRFASQNVGVLIRGETGTGKELIARALYQHSERNQAPFIAVNCSAIPEALLESEMFGHERGAFTGAVNRRIGRFEQADGGTLFLDEIGDLSASTQAKLLRALQERCVARLGGAENVNVDVRVVAATHRDLESMISSGAFREDLYYRLAVAVIRLPPLRDRLEDLPELVNYFARRFGATMGLGAAEFTVDALDLLRRHPWPGNVRELENVVRQALVQAQSYGVTANVLEPILRAAPAGRRTEAPAPLAAVVSQVLDRATGAPEPAARDELLRIVDRELLVQAMNRTQGNLAQAARLLGVSRITLRERLRQLGLRHGESAET